VIPDLVTAAKRVRDAIDDLHMAREATVGDVDAGAIETLIWVHEVLALDSSDLVAERQELDDLIGTLMGPERVTVNGKLYQRHARVSLRNGDNAALLRAVLDSRIVDKTTGEVKEETPVDRITHVWLLAARDARKTALRERGLDQDEFVEREFRGWNITEAR
jgi:hypothetical protein